ncbi:transposase [Paraburkholderia sp. RL17-347-BIC-D]|uniref:transposase n=1 Tax=Paraburkholderia sp. RL17-347-BIC-D TaxID=3031632 RepID=UPI0038BD13C9
MTRHPHGAVRQPFSNHHARSNSPSSQTALSSRCISQKFPQKTVQLLGGSSRIGGHVNTIDQDAPSGRRKRRRYTNEFKAEVVAACQGPGVSVAAIALMHKLNANLLRR